MTEKGASTFDEFMDMFCAAACKACLGQGVRFGESGEELIDCPDCDGTGRKDKAQKPQPEGAD